jgi:hypothetical protein
MSDFPNPNDFTKNGRVVKNAGRIEQVDTNKEVRDEARIASWQVSRWMLRDFNILCARMHDLCEKGESRATARRRIEGLLKEMLLQSEKMEARSKAFGSESTGDDPKTTDMLIRLVSAEAASLFRSLMWADEAYACLNQAHKQSRVTQQEEVGIVEGFESAFSALKRFVFAKSDSNKSAGDLGKEMGIS